MVFPDVPNQQTNVNTGKQIVVNIDGHDFTRFTSSHRLMETPAYFAIVLVKIFEMSLLFSEKRSWKRIE